MDCSCSACAIEPKHINHQVLVLSGEQGVGKSTWLNNLLPKSLNGYLYSGLVNPNNKDTLVNLSENLFINLDELENLNKTELGSLKSMITQSEIKIRKAYAQFNENMPRRSSFMGSVNEAEFLNDTTGNRRFLCFTVKSIDCDVRINMDDVFAQAYSLYLNGEEGKSFKWWFDSSEIQEINFHNDSYLRTSMEEELLLKYFRVPVVGDDPDDIILQTPSNLLIYLEQQESVKLNIRKLGQALVKNNFQKISQQNRKPYGLIMLDDVRSVKSFIKEDEKKQEIIKELQGPPGGYTQYLKKRGDN